MLFEFKDNEYLKDALIRLVDTGTNKIEEANLYFDNLNEKGVDIEFKINGVEFDFNVLYKKLLNSMESSIDLATKRNVDKEIKVRFNDTEIKKQLSAVSDLTVDLAELGEKLRYIESDLERVYLKSVGAIDSLNK